MLRHKIEESLGEFDSLWVDYTKKNEVLLVLPSWKKLVFGYRHGLSCVLSIIHALAKRRNYTD